MVYSPKTLQAFKEFYKQNLHQATDDFVGDLFDYVVDPKVRSLSRNDFRQQLQGLIDRHSPKVQSAMDEAVNYVLELNLKDIEASGKLMSKKTVGNTGCSGGARLAGLSSQAAGYFSAKAELLSKGPGNMASLQKLFECRKRGRAPAETATTTEEEIIILDDSDDEEEEEEEEVVVVVVVNGKGGEKPEEKVSDDDGDDTEGGSSKSKRPRVVSSSSTSSSSAAAGHTGKSLLRASTSTEASTSTFVGQSSTSTSTSTSTSPNACTADTVPPTLKLYTTVSLFCPREECTANREAVGNLASQKAMRRHLASVHQLKAYVCHVRDCGQSFDACFKFLLHTTKEHRRLQCCACEAVLPDHSSLSKHYHLFHVPGVYACSAPGCGLTLTGFLNQINHHWSKEHPVLKMQLLRQETEQKRELLQEPKQQQQQQSIEKVEGKEGAGKEEDGEEEIVEVGGGGGGGAGNEKDSGVIAGNDEDSGVGAEEQQQQQEGVVVANDGDDNGQEKEEETTAAAAGAVEEVVVAEVGVVEEEIAATSSSTAVENEPGEEVAATAAAAEAVAVTEEDKAEEEEDIFA